MQKSFYWVRQVLYDQNQSWNWAEAFAREFGNDVTRANAVSERKKSFRKFDYFNFAVWKKVKTKKVMRLNKNLAGRIPETTKSRTVNILTVLIHVLQYLLSILKQQQEEYNEKTNWQKLINSLLKIVFSWH